MYTIKDFPQTVLESAKKKGYLTYARLNELLPDEAVKGQCLVDLLGLIQGLGIDLVHESETGEREAAVKEHEAKRQSLVVSINRAQEALRRIRLCRKIPEAERLQRNSPVRLSCGYVYLLLFTRDAKQQKIGHTDRISGARFAELKRDLLKASRFHSFSVKYPTVLSFELEQELHRHFGDARVKRKGERRKGERKHESGEEFNLPLNEVIGFRETVAKVEPWVMCAEEARLELEILRAEAAMERLKGRKG